MYARGSVGRQLQLQESVLKARILQVAMDSGADLVYTGRTTLPFTKGADVRRSQYVLEQELLLG